MSSFLNNLQETFQTVWGNFAFLKKLISLTKKSNFLVVVMHSVRKILEEACREGLFN